ncbi:MAG TPA: helix-turn-helix transcriptional regulator [Luteimonas sp.]|nr:helix-turn-helix transcriptional regulator [Luteimonas sp.]
MRAAQANQPPAAQGQRNWRLADNIAGPASAAVARLPFVRERNMIRRLDGSKGTRMGLAERVRRARRIAGLSQQELARALGVTRSAISNWESTNAAQPATDRLARLANALEVSFEWIATGRGEMRLPRSVPAATAVDARLFVDCPHELNLLSAYRRAPVRVKAILQEIANLHSPAGAPGWIRHASR